MVCMHSTTSTSSVRNNFVSTWKDGRKKCIAGILMASSSRRDPHLSGSSTHLHNATLPGFIRGEELQPILISRQEKANRVAIGSILTCTKNRFGSLVQHLISGWRRAESRRLDDAIGAYVGGGGRCTKPDVADGRAPAERQASSRKREQHHFVNRRREQKMLGHGRYCPNTRARLAA